MYRKVPQTLKGTTAKIIANQELVLDLTCL